jgi:uncharacterized protein with NRDE domain
VAQVCARLDPADYNPCWLLVGDRDRLFSIDVSAGHRPLTEELPPGRYVLENTPLRRGSAKQRQVAGLIAAADAAQEPAAAPEDGADGLVAALATVLRDHRPAAGPQPAGDGLPARPAELSAACVHTPRYGTRSAMIVAVGDTGRPRLSAADGPPCTTPLLDQTGLWASPAPGPAVR